MNKHNFLFVGIFVFMFLLVLPSALAWGPHTHNYITDTLKSEYSDNTIVRLCLDGGINEEAFRAGSMTPDITVIYYWSNGGENYKASHNWNFQQELMTQANTENERCFAYGVAAHLVEDSVAHMYAVPEGIESTGIPNWIAHPLLEKKYDSELLSEHPEIEEETKHMFDAFYGEYGNRYIQMIEYSFGENTNFDVAAEIDNLAFALDSFYEDGFAPNVKDNSIFAIYPIIDDITNFIHPIVGKWNVKDLDLYMDRTPELAASVFNNWGSRYALSPHGFEELSEADDSANIIIPMLLILLIIFGVLFPLYKVYETGKIAWSFLFLLTIPAVLIGLIIVYALL